SEEAPIDNLMELVQQVVVFHIKLYLLIEANNHQKLQYEIHLHLIESLAVRKAVVGSERGLSAEVSIAGEEMVTL
ncbi:hypothetical protein RYX36_020619, partial [Vicia faba]